MNFISVEFIILLLVSSTLYYIVPKKHRWKVLLVANIFFYIYSSKLLSIFLLLSILTVYITGLGIKKLNSVDLTKLDKDTKKQKRIEIKKAKKLILLIAVLINLGFLIELKYNGFINEIVNLIFRTNLSGMKFVLPLGISYYTLEAISYIADVYNEKIEAETNICKLSLYLSFFPLMVEGPISRYSELGSQLYEPHTYNYDRSKKGLLLILWGFIKKLVIADRAAIFVNAVFSSQSGNFVTILAMILYTLEIYAEFSGCMDIVKGSALLFGIEVPDNFKRPFFSTTISEFWRRWHITLGTFLRDYVFYPVSLSKVNLKLSMRTHKWHNQYLARFVTLAFPTLFVWLAMGIWHGASFKYVVYGLYYYIIMMIGVLLKPVIDYIITKCHIKTNVFSYKLLQIIKTTIIVIIGMTMFRCTTLASFGTMISSIFDTSTYKLTQYGLQYSGFFSIFVYTFIIFIVSLLQERGIDVLEKIKSQNLYFEWAIYLFLIFSFLIYGMYGSGYTATSFIYGGF